MMSGQSGSGLEVYAERMSEILTADPIHGLPSEPTRLLDHVYIGNQTNAETLRTLQRLHVTHVLNCAGYQGPRQHASPYVGLDINYLEFKAEDVETYDISRHFAEACAFLDDVKRRRGVALVHCALGVNRSGAVCVAYLMHAERMTLFEATRLIKAKRSLVLANKGFQRRLVRFAKSRGLLDKHVETATTRLHRKQQEEWSERAVGANCVVEQHRRPPPSLSRDVGRNQTVTSVTSSGRSPCGAAGRTEEGGVGRPPSVSGRDCLSTMYDTVLGRLRPGSNHW